MVKMIIWVLLIAGLVAPVFLSIGSVIVARAMSASLERARLGAGGLGGGAVHDSAVSVRGFGKQISVNPALYPAVIILVGACLITVGTAMMLHVGVQPVGEDMTIQ